MFGRRQAAVGAAHTEAVWFRSLDGYSGFSERDAKK